MVEFSGVGYLSPVMMEEVAHVHGATAVEPVRRAVERASETAERAGHTQL